MQCDMLCGINICSTISNPAQNIFVFFVLYYTTMK